mgnify:CR=1 FL=1
MNENNRRLHDLGQSLWVDNITRGTLDDGTLKGYIEDLSVTGLTSNPTIFEKAIGGGNDYDAPIAELAASESDPEQIFFELAMADLRRAADDFEEIHEKTDRVDGYVSLAVSPLLADDTEATIAQAADLYERIERKNVFIKIPGTPAGLPAIEETIFAGIPVAASAAGLPDRDSDPVVLTGADTPGLIGSAPTDVVAFSYEGSWSQVPVQVDERKWADYRVIRRVSLGNQQFGNEVYADAGTWTEADGRPGRLSAEIGRPEGLESVNVVIPWSDDEFNFTSKQWARPVVGQLSVGERTWVLALSLIHI